MGVPIQSPPVVRESYTWLAHPSAGGAQLAQAVAGSGVACTCTGTCSGTITCDKDETCSCTTTPPFTCTCVEG
jgi:hypothetical protein